MLFSSFAEEAFKDRVAESSAIKHFNHVQFVFKSSENWSKFKLNQFLRNSFTDLQFLFVVILIFRLTEQFEIVDFLFARETINSLWSKRNFDVSLCPIFEWTFSRGLSRFRPHVSRTGFKSLNVIKEMVNMHCASIKLWMHSDVKHSKSWSRIRLSTRATLTFLSCLACIHDKGVARIFERGVGGGRVTVCQSEGTHQIFMFLVPLVVGFLLKKSSQNGGGSRAPKDPLTNNSIVARCRDAARLPFLCGHSWRSCWHQKVESR